MIRSNTFSFRLWHRFSDFRTSVWRYEFCCSRRSCLFTNQSAPVPHFGRNVPYIATFAIFTILTLPASLVDNFGGLLVLRFLLGLFGSPCLANGGASVGVCASASSQSAQCLRGNAGYVFPLISSLSPSGVGFRRVCCTSTRPERLALVRLSLSLYRLLLY